MESFHTGSNAGAGSFRCGACGFAVALLPGDEMPVCPACDGRHFEPAPLFNRFGHASRAGASTTEETPSLDTGQPPDWLERVRRTLPDDGVYVAFEGEGGVAVKPLRKGWTRIGRSLLADVRLDDPTVSRRHALLNSTGDTVEVLDDRSLNGVLVNGERVDLAELGDGDTLAIGRFELYVLRGARDRRPLAV